MRPPEQPRGAPRSRPPPRAGPALGIRAVFSDFLTSQSAPPGPRSHAVTSQSTVFPPRLGCLAERLHGKSGGHQSKANPLPASAPPEAPESRRESACPVPLCIKKQKPPHMIHICTYTPRMQIYKCSWQLSHRGHNLA